MDVVYPYSSRTVIVSNVAPTRDKEYKLWFNTNTGWNVLMYWDKPRLKWLSVDSIVETYGKAANGINANTYLSASIGGYTSNISGIPLTRNATIVELSSSTSSIKGACTFDIGYRSLVTGTITSGLTSISQIATSRYAKSLEENTDLSVDTHLVVRVTVANKIEYPTVNVTYKWRWTV